MEFRKILIPINGTKVDEDATRLGCRLAKVFKSKLYLVFVITIKRTLPLETEITTEIEKAEQLLEHIESITKDQGCKMESDVIQAREAGSAIVDEAVEREIDLILMGISYKKRFGEFSLGDTAMYVLKNAPCKVILFQERTEKEAE